MSDTLRTRLIRLAHAKPELRPHLLPLLAGHTKRASDELRFKIQQDIAEEKAKVKAAIPRIVANHMEGIKREFKAKFPKWDVKMGYKYEEPKRFGIGHGVTYDNGSMSVSVEVDRDSHEDFYTDIEDIETIDEWLRSTCGVSLGLRFGGAYSLEPSDFPLKHSWSFTL